MPSVENLIQGVGYLYIAEFGATEPADGDIHDAPAVAWTNLGYTMDGVTLTISTEYSELSTDQLADIPARRITQRTMVLSTNLAEPTLENLQYALNKAGTFSAAASTAAASTSGTDTWEPDEGLTTTHPTYAALLFDGVAPGGFVRRVIVRKGLQTGEIEAAYTKDGQTVFPVEFSAHYVSNSIKPYKVIDQTAVPTG